MDRVLMATDLTEGSSNALHRAFAIAVEADADLRVVHVHPAASSDSADRSDGDRLGDGLADRPAQEPGARLSIESCRGDPVEAILDQADRFGADLIVLGAHGEPRLRDAIFGTTAGHIIREAKQPVLIAQNDPDRAYRKMLVAVDDEAAEQVLDLALAFAAPDQVHVVHAFGSVAEALAGAGDVLEEVRTEQDVLVARLRKKLAGSGRQPARIETIVEEGDPMDVIMRAWKKVEPDLVVMGTHGRTGVAHLLRGSVAETALLGCPCDMLIMRISDRS